MLENRVLLHDKISDFTTDDLGKRCLTERFYYPFYQTDNLTELLVNLIKAIHSNNEICLVDPHFTTEEIKSVGIESKLNKPIALENVISDIETALSNLVKSHSEITIFTSGTTGVPKKITHTTHRLFKNLKLSDEMMYKVWALTYNPTHMAGLQVIFQSLCTKSTMVNLYQVYEKEQVFKQLDTYNIDMISATPTFYRMLLPTQYTNTRITQVTLGGEKSDSQLIVKLKKIFINARIRNVFATTESGSLFSAEDDIFTVSPTKENDIKIVNNELFIKAELLGFSNDIDTSDNWYNTGDVVEILCDKPLKFRFVSRASSIINVGGNKVDPYEVEDAIRGIPGIRESRVFGKKNSVTGMLICCEVVLNGQGQIDDKMIIDFLKGKLADYKMPRIIKFVDKIETTRTGKIKRN